MQPIQHEHTNVVYTLPGGTEENNLPVERTEDAQGRTCLVSTWKPNDQELKALIAGGYVSLAIWSSGHPPVSVRVQPVDDGGNLEDELVPL